jgi:flagellar biosynthetic protein FliO
MIKIKKILVLYFFAFAASFSPIFGADESPTQTQVIENKQHTTQPPAPSRAPFEDINEEFKRPSEDRFMSDFINMLFSLGLLVALILIVSWFLKKFLNTRIQQVNTTSLIKIIERRALTPKTTVYVLEVNNKQIVIAESSNGVTKLAENGFEKEETEQTQPEKPRPSFGQILNNKMDQNKPS